MWHDRRIRGGNFSCDTFTTDLTSFKSILQKSSYDQKQNFELQTEWPATFVLTKEILVMAADIIRDISDKPHVIRTFPFSLYKICDLPE